MSDDDNDDDNDADFHVKDNTCLLSEESHKTS